MQPLASPLLATVPGVRHGFFTRCGGRSTGAFTSLNAGRGVGDEPAAVQDNLDRIASALGIEATTLATVRQVHSAHIVAVDRMNIAVVGAREADALLTADRGVAVAVRTADCVPMLVTTGDGAVAVAVHGGWRGLAAGVIEATVAELRSRGIGSDRLLVAIGPHIGPCCYRVGAEVVAALGPGSGAARDGQLYADLGAVARERWCRSGVPAGQIDDVVACTACDAQRFFSHRRDRGITGRQLSAIGRIP